MAVRERRRIPVLDLLPARWHLFGVDGDARLFLFGSDNLGRDLFSRVIYATRVTMSIGLLGVAVSFVQGCCSAACSATYPKFNVRRRKALCPSGCESRPATVAPAGSSRSGAGR